MELKDFKQRLEKKINFCAIFFNNTEKTFFKGAYYEITGKHANFNCGVCENSIYKTLLDHLNKEPELTLSEQYINKYNKPLPNRYKYNETWIKSKL
jgi:hypothetical protein